MTNEKPIVTNKIELEYHFPPFYKRVLANLVDAIFFILAFVALFIGARGIVSSTPEYKTTMIAMAQIKVDSCLFVPDDPANPLYKNAMLEYLNSEEKQLPEDIKDVVDLISVIKTDRYGSETRLEISSAAVKGFLAYCKEVCTEEKYQVIVTDYETFMLSDSLVDGNGIHYFIKDGEGNIIENEAHTEIDRILFTKTYVPYFDKHAQGYLITSIPTYYEYSRYLSNMLLFVEIPIAYSVAGLLIYLLPLFIFRRGRKTFGKAIYRIGLVDSNFLSPKIGRTLSRFFIFYFGVLILSLLTFGIPFFVSFSLMAFTKKKQGFADYMLGILEVDTYRTKIYMSTEEIALRGVNTHSKAVDFKVREKL